MGPTRKARRLEPQSRHKPAKPVCQLTPWRIHPTLGLGRGVEAVAWNPSNRRPRGQVESFPCYISNRIMFLGVSKQKGNRVAAGELYIPESKTNQVRYF